MGRIRDKKPSAFKGWNVKLKEGDVSGFIKIVNDLKVCNLFIAYIIQENNHLTFVIFRFCYQI